MIEKADSFRDKLSCLTATFFYSGYLPKAPGTWGSAFTALILYFIWPHSWLIQMILIYAVYLIGVVASSAAEKFYGHDGRPIVIDEVAGQMLALFMVPKALIPFLLSFLLFRIYDIIKPPPARQWESLRAGKGVMMDDMAAGAYAVLTVHFILALLDKFGVQYI